MFLIAMSTRQVGVRVVGQVDDDLGVGAVLPLPVQNCIVWIYFCIELSIAHFIGSTF